MKTTESTDAATLFEQGVAELRLEQAADGCPDIVIGVVSRFGDLRTLSVRTMRCSNGADRPILLKKSPYEIFNLLAEKSTPQIGLQTAREHRLRGRIPLKTLRERRSATFSTASAEPGRTTNMESIPGEGRRIQTSHWRGWDTVTRVRSAAHAGYGVQRRPTHCDAAGACRLSPVP